MIRQRRTIKDITHACKILFVLRTASSDLSVIKPYFPICFHVQLTFQFADERLEDNDNRARDRDAIY